MVPILIMLIIGLPWLGALIVWRVGDLRPRWQHGLATAFAAATGLASLGLLFFTGERWTISLPVGGGFGEEDSIAVLKLLETLSGTSR